MLRLFNCARSRFSGTPSCDSSDHALHFVCALLGTAYAVYALPLAHDLPAAQLIALFSLLAARVFCRNFPL
jgi:hypothetical protein